MKRLGIFCADGCEEIECLTVVDILRRGGIYIDMISISNQEQVTGSHQICFRTDRKISDVDWDAYDGLILPGGMPGTNYLKKDKTVNEQIKAFCKAGKLVAAICAAPTVLGAAGLLKGREATCYPGMEEGLTGAKVVTDQPVVIDGNVITSRGMGTAIAFSLCILAYFTDEKTAVDMGNSIVYS